MGSDTGRDLTVRVSGGDAAGELRSLMAWLGRDIPLRGRARLVPDGDTTGTLGGGLEILSVALAPGGVAAAFATAFVAWIRSRRGNFEVEIERDGKKLKVTSTNVRELTMAEINEQTSRLGALLDEPGQAVESRADEGR
jgi:hypothetical protein